MAYDIQQSTTQQKLLFLMVLSSDHITGATGLSPTVTISKAGGAFASPSGAVTELANGWYQVAANATDTNTLGPILLHATAATADPTDIVVANVVAYNPQDATALGLSRIDAAVTSRMATFTLPTNFSAFSINASGFVTVVTNNDKTGYTVSTNQDKTGYELDATGSAALTEGYRTSGSTGTIAQLLYEILAHLGEASISGTTKTLKKLDHATTAETFTLDSSSAPTSITRAT